MTLHFVLFPIVVICFYISTFTSFSGQSLFVGASLVPLPNCNTSDPSITCELYDPNLPLVPCSLVPDEFLDCALNCSSIGGSAYQQVPQNGISNCTVFSSIECVGDRVFLRTDPCKIVGYKYYTTMLILSIFAGLFGVDRFYAGYLCCGFAKLFTLGGVGVWWLVDLILLLAGTYYTADGSAWASTW